VMLQREQLSRYLPVEVRVEGQLPILPDQGLLIV
jgi:hypothetical protein